MRRSAAFLLGGMLLLTGAPALSQQGVHLPEGQTLQVAPHVHVIMGFPNIGIVVGSKTILVVDTGLGTENGAVVAREAQKLALNNQRIILTTTHMHPEHASGQAGFPAGTTVIRPSVQQDEMEQEEPGWIAIFSKRSADNARLLSDTRITKADVLFDRRYTLDLGGVHADLYHFGTAHTRGDEVIFVPEDRLILPGDVVQNRIAANISCASCSPRKWIAVLDDVAKLKPQYIVPDHGALGTGALIAQERAYLLDLDTQAMSLKQQGISVGEAGKRITADFAVKYKGWSGLDHVVASVALAYADMR